MLEGIASDLAGAVVSLAHAPAPSVRRLKNVQHLHTPVAGALRPGETVLSVLARLHPTAAVGGLPREGALAAIAAAEGMDRGWYAGPVGWVDADGDGEFAVALRSALLAGNRADLYAGVGVVGESEPAAEWDETEWKLAPVRRALGVAAERSAAGEAVRP